MLYKILRFSSILCTLYCATSECLEHPYWLLCLFYSIYLLLFHNKNLFVNNPGIITLHIAMCGRYMLLPMSFYLNGYSANCAHDMHYLDNAFLVMIYEEICVFLSIIISSRWIKKKLNSKVEPNIVGLYEKSKYKRKSLIMFFIFLVFVGITISIKNLNLGFSVFLSGAYNQFKDFNIGETSFFHNIINIIWQMLLVGLYIYSLNYIKIRYIENPTNRYLLLAILLSFTVMIISFIDQTGLSRWYTIIMSATCVSCLCIYFPKKKKTILISMLIPLGAIIGLATAIKNGGYTVGDSNSADTFAAILEPNMIDSYFAGPANITNAIGVSNTYNVGLHNLINDALHNMPVINHFLSYKETTVYFHNLHAGRISATSNGDQIIPLLGQSFIYFGYVLSPILSFISIFIIRWADYKFNSNSTPMIFVYAFMAIWLGVQAMALNFTICLSWFYVRIIPDIIILYILNKFVYKGKFYVK